ncbi:unnamed protein product [Ranitomeya imitator]|nr:unnamed protein product [Ranitomeya imitator]
MGCLCPV